MTNVIERTKQLIEEYAKNQHFIVLNDAMASEVVKRRLHLIRGLSPKSDSVTLNELNSLKPQDLNLLVKHYQQHAQAAGLVKPTSATTLAQSLINQSPYHYEITTNKTEASPPEASSVHVTDNPNSPKPAQTINGISLKEDEVLSATRYYSQDKQQFGKITVNNGVFNILSQQLNLEQSNDLAFESSVQFLMNLTPPKNEVYIKGTGPMSPPIYASFLYLKKELGTHFTSRWPNFKIIPPAGMSEVQLSAEDAYIKQHLGTLSSIPQQVAHLKTLLTQVTHEAVAQKKEAQDVPQPQDVKPPVREPLIDLEKCLLDPNLSQDDKALLTEYAALLKSHLTAPTDKSAAFLSQEQLLLQKTEAVLSCLQKSAHFEPEFKSLSLFYEKTKATHQKMHQQLAELDQAYEREREALTQQIAQKRKVVCTNFIALINKSLQTPAANDAAHAEQTMLFKANMVQVSERMNEADSDSPLMLRALYTQIHHALTYIEKEKLCLAEDEGAVLKAKAFFQERTAVLNPPIDVPAAPAVLPTASAVTMKEQLKRMKAADDKGIILDPEELEQLKVLCSTTFKMAELFEGREDERTIKKLSSVLNELTNSSDIELGSKLCEKARNIISKSLTVFTNHPEAQSHLKQVLNLINGVKISPQLEEPLGEPSEMSLRIK